MYFDYKTLYMLRIISFFILLIVYSQVGYTQCNTITTSQSLVFSNQWTEYLQYSNTTYQGQKTPNLLVDRQFYYTMASSANINGKIINTPAKGYKVSKDCFLPLSVGDINNIHTLKRTFPKGFYTIKLMLQGATMSNILFLYGNGTVSNNISLSTALSYSSSTSVNGLNNRLHLGRTHDSDILEKVVYLDGETNILIYAKGKLEAFDPNSSKSQSFKPFNSFQCSITPLSAPQQLCANYTAIVDEKNSFCGLGAVSMEVLDANSKYLFFYKDNTNTSYKVHSNILTPNNNREIYINNISYTGNNIPEWGIIRMVDGCTFYEPSKPIQFPNQNFQINSFGTELILPKQCGLSKGGINIRLSSMLNGGIVKEGVYEIILQGQVASNTSYLKFTTEVSITKDANNNFLSNLIVGDIPLNFSISNIKVLNVETNCTAELNGNYSFTPLIPPSISINSELEATICATKLTLQGTDDFPCGKIVWYEGNKEISTSKSIIVSPIVETTYTAKFFLDNEVFVDNKKVDAKVIPIIDNIKLSSNPYITYFGIPLNVKPMTNVNITSTNCQCNYIIKNIKSNTTVITSTNCEMDISSSSLLPGTYSVMLNLSYNGCQVSTSQLLEVINPFSPANQTTSNVANLGELYPTTKSLLDEAYFIKVQNGTSIVNFQYNQQYEPFSSSKISAKLYNWKREVVAFSEISRAYGVQWYSMNLPNNIVTTSGSYILELTDDNGWFQKIRVKNIAANPTCGVLKPESTDYCTITNNGFKLYEIKNGQAPYQVKWTLSNTDDIVLEEKILTTQTDFSLYKPSITFNNNTNYKLVVDVVDACGTLVCTKNKSFEAKACSAPINERIIPQEEIPKFELRINVLPQTPMNPNVPIIKN